MLLDVTDRVKPLLPGYQLSQSRGVVSVFTSKPKRTIGFLPENLGDETVQVGDFAVAHSEETGDMYLAASRDRANRKILLTIPGSGRTVTLFGTETWSVDYRIPEATAELAAFLKGEG